MNQVESNLRIEDFSLFGSITRNEVSLSLSLLKQPSVEFCK